MTEFATHGDVTIAYETVGEPTGEPLLLLMGTLGQRIGWPDGFCAALHDRGFHVVRFDNRDVGESTHLPPPRDRRPRALRTARPRAAYTLDDMAGDVLAVLDDLGWTSAHVVGISAGGTLGQLLAARHGDRVRTLTSISSTPWVRIGRMRAGTMMRMVRAGRRVGRPTDPAAVAAAMLTIRNDITGSPAYEADADAMRAMVRLSLQRDPGFLTGGRGFTAALGTAPDLRPELAAVRVPVLVIHGDADVVIRPDGGRATAAAIPGARLIEYPGLGHELPHELWTPIADQIAALADQPTSTA
jgi:pimeloyl-ACP methyl ester carboxylesterase